MFMDGRLNVVKMPVLLQIELYIQWDSNKNFSSFLFGENIYKPILKCIWKWEQLRLDKLFWKEK